MIMRLISFDLVLEADHVALFVVYASEFA
jgi:hypothetical protein